MDFKILKQSDLQKCPFYIFVPSHYREDGSCKCNSKAERERMIREWDYQPEDFPTPATED